MAKPEEILTPEQLKNTIALYMTLLEKFSPELYELKKVMDIFMPHIWFGEINAKFIVQNGKIVKVDSYPMISKKIYDTEKS